jgi:SAM-dependent methyltransferase
MSEDAGWRFILGPGKTGRLLCLEKSHGKTALALTRVCRELSVIHHDPNVLRAIQQTLTGQGVASVTFSQAWEDGKRFPFPDEYFDGFIMIDVTYARVFQTVPNASNIGSALQLLLAEAYRVLKRGGYAYASLRNRYGYDNLAKILQKGDISGRFECSNNHVSFGTFKNAANKSGFDSVRSYKLLTDKDDVNEIILGKNYNPAKNSFTLKERIKRSLLSSPLASVLAPSLGVVCLKGEPHPSCLDELVDDLIDRGVLSKHDNQAFAVKRYLVLPGKVILSVGVVGKGYGEKIVVLPLNAAVLDRLRNEARILDALRGAHPRIQPLIPEFYLEGEFCGQVYLVQQEMPGTTIDAPVSSLDEITWRALQVLIDFHRETSREVALDVDFFGTLFSNPLHRVVEKLGPSVASSIHRIEGILRTAVLGKLFKLVWMHGDFKIENLMIDPKDLRISGIIDWDLSQREGLPFLDFLYLIAYNRVIREGKEIEEIFLDYIIPHKLSKFERAARDEYLSAVGVDGEFVEILMAMFWIYHVAFRIEITSRAGKPIEKMLRVLSTVEKTIEAKYG